ncbi:MAG: dTMP kinase [Nanoarchaeota archaeon]|nr:dTMP kinase [Nanoarchaeota archaeon]
MNTKALCDTLFIALEGLDGSGKDTQLNILIDEIKSSKNSLFGDKYSNIWITRQPTKITKSGVEISEKIKQEHVSKEEATKGFVQDRIEHSQIIKEILNHSFVLTSRCDFSTLVYQYAQGMNLDELYEMHKYKEQVGTLIPDITLIFKIPAQVGLSRILGGRQEVPKECFEQLEFLELCEQKEREVIEYLRKKDGRCIIEINANQSIEDVTKEMILKLEKWWEKQNNN